MAILSIARDWGSSPSIVRVTTTDNFATITAAEYLTAQEANIRALNKGSFVWVTGDLVAIVYSGGEDYFTRDAVNNTFVLDVIPAGAIPLPSAQILVGNAAGVAAAVAMTGDIAITNTGVTAIQPGVIVNNDISNAAAIAYSKLAALATGSMLLGVANVATVTAIGGYIRYTAQVTTVGGAAAEAIAIPGVLVTDKAFVQVVDDGTGNVTALQAVCTANTLTVTFSGDPGNDTIINYQIVRASS